MRMSRKSLLTGFGFEAVLQDTKDEIHGANILARRFHLDLLGKVFCANRAFCVGWGVRG